MTVLTLYSTPLFNSEYSNFEEEKDFILESIESFMNQNPNSINLSNFCGFESSKNLHTYSNFSKIFEYIHKSSVDFANSLKIKDFDCFITSSWLNIISNKYQFNFKHSHADTFSGVFYIKTPENSGKLNIFNPGMNSLWDVLNLANEKNMFISDSVKLDPKEGELYIWPSFVEHSVEPNQLEENRISISFNIKLLPKGLMDNINIKNA